MIVLYPKNYPPPSIPEGVDIYYYNDGEDPYNLYQHAISGMYDTVVLKVLHDPNVSLMYESSLKCYSNTHIVKTWIDCDHPSCTLALLINKFEKIENIWNEN